MKRFCLICVAFVAPLLMGCSQLLPPRPEPTQMMLSEVPDWIPSSHRHTATLLLLPPEAGAAYDTMRMAYRIEPYQLGYFRDNEWAETPSEMIQPLLVKMMQQTGFFRAVLTQPEAGGTSYALRTEILELLQDYTVSPPVLRLSLRLQLRSASGRPAGSHDVIAQETIQKATPYGGVVAANHALAEALRQATQFVLDAVRQTAQESEDHSIFRKVPSRSRKWCRSAALAWMQTSTAMV